MAATMWTVSAAASTAHAARRPTHRAMTGADGGGIGSRVAVTAVSAARHRRRRVTPPLQCAADDASDAADAADAADASDAASGPEDLDVELATGLVHAEYVRNVAAVPPPSELGALVAVLRAQGMTLMAPSDRKGLHPLCIPLAKTMPAVGGGGGETVCLMVSPLEGISTQVVAARGINLRLLAKTCKEYVHKALVEEEAFNTTGDGDAADVVAAAAGRI